MATADLGVVEEMILHFTRAEIEAHFGITTPNLKTIVLQQKIFQELRIPSSRIARKALQLYKDGNWVYKPVPQNRVLSRGRQRGKNYPQYLPRARPQVWLLAPGIASSTSTSTAPSTVQNMVPSTPTSISIRTSNSTEPKPDLMELDSSNAAQRVSLHDELLKKADPTDWHKVIIETEVPETDRQSVITAINNRIAPEKIVPYFFCFENGHITFFVNMCCPVLKTLCSQDNFTVPYSTSSKFANLEMKLKLFSKKYDLLEALKGIVLRRLDREGKYLDLSCLNNIPEVQEMLYDPSDSSHLLDQLLVIAEEMEPELVSLSLASNGLTTLITLRNFLAQSKWKSLRVLDLTDNKLKNTDSVSLSRALDITELYLHRNPICGIYTTNLYIRSIKTTFPHLYKLDGTYVSTTPCVPISKPNFIVSSNCGDLGERADQFVKRFFTLYDTSDRARLRELYHKDAYFSISSSYLSGQSTTQNARLSCYIGQNRNLLRCTDILKRRQTLACGWEKIVAQLSKLPETVHDSYTFSVDIVVHLAKLTVLTVTGVFHDVTEEKRSPRHFMRTFVLTGLENDEYQIINDIMYVTNAATQEAEVGTSLPTTKCVPIWKPNFIVSHYCGDSGEIANQFVKHFFTLYDTSDRVRLCKLYHQDAYFSVSSSYLSGQLTTHNARLSCYIGQNRNLLRCTDILKRKQTLACGWEKIVAQLSKLPKTVHDPSTFSVDIVVHSAKLTVLTVTGIFRDVTEEERSPRHFMRTFVLTGLENDEYQIINDIMYVTNAATQEAEVSHSVKDGTSLSTTKCMPIWKPNFIVSSDCGDSGEIANLFVENFFTLYDTSDRVSLRELYHKDAYFSISCSYLSGQLTTHNARLSCYIGQNRNLLRCTDILRRKQMLVYGSEKIVARLSKLPKTVHDPYTFTVDLVVHSAKLTVLTITGIFREVSEEKRSPRQFMRTFVLTGQENDEYQIINDIMYVTNAATQEAEDGTSLPTTKSVPIWKPNFIVKSNCGDSGELADQFVEHFFTLYDTSDRIRLRELYHKDAYFSISSSYLSGESTTHNARLSCYIGQNRNLLRCTDILKRRQMLARGSEKIVARLSKLPKTVHDPYTFTVDLAIHSAKLTVLTVTGIFREVSEEERSPRHFMRTFVLTALENNEYQIINDIMYVTNAATREAEMAFRFVKPYEKIRKFGPQRNLSESEKESMLGTVQKLTEMSAEWSRKCLDDSGWDLKEALQFIVELYKTKKTPESGVVNLEKKAVKV